MVSHISSSSFSGKKEFKQLPIILNRKIFFHTIDYSETARGLLFKMDFSGLCTRNVIFSELKVETARDSLSLHARHQLSD